MSEFMTILTANSNEYKWGEKRLMVGWLAAVPRKTPTMPTSEKTERYLMICCCDRLDLRKATRSAIDSAGWCSAIDVASSAA